MVQTGGVSKALNNYFEPTPAERSVAYVIEDDTEMREALCECLQGLGYQVVEAANGARVLGHWPRLRTEEGTFVSIDLLVTDLVLPGASGLEVLADLRRTDWSTQAILVTGHADEVARRRASELGACVVLPKPFTMAEFLEAVQGAAPMPISAY